MVEEEEEEEEEVEEEEINDFLWRLISIRKEKLEGDEQDIYQHHLIIKNNRNEEKLNFEFSLIETLMLQKKRIVEGIKTFPIVITFRK